MQEVVYSPSLHPRTFLYLLYTFLYLPLLPCTFFTSLYLPYLPVPPLPPLPPLPPSL